MFFVIGLFASTTLYAIILLLINWAVFETNVSKILVIAIAGYVVLHAVRYFWSKICKRFGGNIYIEGSYISSLPGCIWGSITSPFRGLFAIRAARKTIDSSGFWFIYMWGQCIVHFIWAVALLSFFVFHIVALI